MIRVYIYQLGKSQDHPRLILGMGWYQEKPWKAPLKLLRVNRWHPSMFVQRPGVSSRRRCSALWLVGPRPESLVQAQEVGRGSLPRVTRLLALHIYPQGTAAVRAGNPAPTAPEKSLLIVSETKLDILACSASPARVYFWRLLTDHAVENLEGGTSLVVQWLRICLPIQGTWVRSLLWKISHLLRSIKSMCHNYWARAPEPANCSEKSLCPTARIAVLVGEPY